ncbi:pirin family protein [Pectobacterium brasiliense]|uniref:pirin family protein n=1 Tax=Pectobacterium brasiliense TaxID=180957 RepID=UPI0019697EEC|nr:pirin-like C-terminal cupin domain-containing protein [Pectobacterium brasiliense]MBN3229323.1 pirin family protein [Pectobacterium brasiliense]
MAIHITEHRGHPRGGSGFSVNSIDLHARGAHASPVIMLDDFRVEGRPFQPHPHAGFSAVTYVFEDSLGGVRSGDSLGNDIRVGPGGIVWTQAGHGVLHHEVPAQHDRQLHGAQIFVNLSARNKLLEPQVLWLDGPSVPEWRGEYGDRVRVVVGRFGSLSSPLIPAEEFTLLDLEIQGHVDLEVLSEQYALLYVSSGKVYVSPTAGHPSDELPSGHAVTIRGSGGFRVSASPSARVLFLAGQELHEPIVMNGPFIMNTQAEIADAVRRFEEGQMGQLAPLLSD